MPRIRTIKPEFWSDGKIIRAGFISRLLFIGLWNFSDDHGVLSNDPMEIKAKIFPGDDIDITKNIDELATLGLICKYEKDGRELLLVKNFLGHQRIDRPRISNLPLPDKADDHMKSREIMRYSAKGKERKGKERKEKNIGDKSPSESKVEKLKKEIEGLQDKFQKAWVANLPFYSEKYSGLDLAFQYQNISDWIQRKPAKAKNSASGDLNLFFQRWLNKEKPDFKKRPANQNYCKVLTNEEIQAHESKRKKERAMELPKLIQNQKDLLDSFKEAMAGGGLDPMSIRRMNEIPERIKELQEELKELRGEK